MNMHNFDIETDDRSYMYERTTYNHKAETKQEECIAESYNKPLSYQEYNLKRLLAERKAIRGE